jgi:hypothetical protein
MPGARLPRHWWTRFGVLAPPSGLNALRPPVGSPFPAHKRRSMS